MPIHFILFLLIWTSLAPFRPVVRHRFGSAEGPQSPLTLRSRRARVKSQSGPMLLVHLGLPVDWRRAPVLEDRRILFSYKAHRSHINFMPTGPALEPFRDELKFYKTGKDTMQIPYDRPLPRALVRQVAACRVKDVEDNDARWMY
jgi:hypothetical protein